MLLSLRLLALFVVLFLFSCNDSKKYPYSINNFRERIQPHLTKMVEKGVVMHDKTFNRLVTDQELKKLSQSEHPILRVYALRQMLERQSFNHFEVVMNHLDDTAYVTIDKGEFGFDFEMVSDDHYIKQPGKLKGKKT